MSARDRRQWVLRAIDEGGRIRIMWEGNLTPAEIGWVLDDVKMKLHQQNSDPLAGAEIKGMPAFKTRSAP